MLEYRELHALRHTSPETTVLGQKHVTREHVLLHELHHLPFLVLDPNGNQISDNNGTYGDQACRDLAQSSPELTFQTADCYTYFAVWAYLMNADIPEETARVTQQGSSPVPQSAQTQPRVCNGRSYP